MGLLRIFFQVIKQLTFLHDLIEINGGKCVKLSSRCIVKTPLEVSDIEKVSPRIYCDFTLTRTSGDDGYFSNSILNSFPEVPKRVEFLNKFYQCLLYGQLPHKAKKLVVCGANNSGKSSWARIFFGLMNKSKIVSVTKEKTFGLSMVDEDTELIFIDECPNSIDYLCFRQLNSRNQNLKHLNGLRITQRSA